MSYWLILPLLEGWLLLNRKSNSINGKIRVDNSLQDPTQMSPPFLSPWSSYTTLWSHCYIEWELFSVPPVLLRGKYGLCAFFWPNAYLIHSSYSLWIKWIKSSKGEKKNKNKIPRNTRKAVSQTNNQIPHFTRAYTEKKLIMKATGDYGDISTSCWRSWIPAPRPEHTHQSFLPMTQPSSWKVILLCYSPGVRLTAQRDEQFQRLHVSVGQIPGSYPRTTHVAEVHVY